MTPVVSHAGQTLKCLSGDMELSRNLHDRLSDVFINHSRRAESKAFRWGGRWFCPGCGTPMKTEDAHVRCETCGEYLDEFIHSLVELHPHLIRLILTVEDTFSIRERGVVLAPPLPASETRPRRFAVELHRPDGSVVWAMALVEIAISGQAYRAHLRLPDIAKSDVPLGTKVWIR